MITAPARLSWPSAAGEMADRIRAKAWHNTPLGAVERWPQSLRTILDLMLSFRQPAYVAWGPRLTSFYNDACTAILGEKHPGALGLPMADAWPEIWNELQPLVGATMAGEAQYEIDREFELAGRVGKPTSWLTFSFTPIRDDDGSICGIFAVASETTDKVLAEQARLQLALDVAELGTWSWDLVNGTGEIDARGAEIVGLDPGDLDNVVDAQLKSIHPDDLPIVHATITNGIAHAEPFSLDYRVVLRDGTIKHVSSRAGVITDESGRPVRLAGTNRDVTPERQSAAEVESARIETEQRKRLYEAVTANTPDLIYVFDRNYRFTYANEALLTMWGRTWEESIGKSLIEVGYEPWHAEMHEREIDHVIATKERIRGEVSFPHATLGRRIYDYIFSPVLNQDGEVEAISGTTRDITELRKLAQQKDEFIGIVSHELKTPVTSVKAYTQILLRRFRKAGDEPSAQLLERLESQLDKLTGLIGDLLDITKIDSGQLRFHDERFPIDPLVEETIEALQFTTDRHDIMRIGSTGRFVRGDRERTGQVLANLLSNAIKYAPESGSIVVETRSDDSEVIISVRDFGVGIPTEDAERVFDRFYRIRGPHHDSRPGLGLGLYIAAEIVRRQGGRIWADASVSSGSLVSFTMPVSAVLEPVSPNAMSAGAVAHPLSEGGIR